MIHLLKLDWHTLPVVLASINSMTKNKQATNVQLVSYG